MGELIVVRVLITSAAGRIGQSVAHSAAAGAMLGYGELIRLHLLDDLAHRHSLDALRRTLLQGGYPLLDGVEIAENMEQACDGVYFAIVIAECATTSHYSRVPVMRRNYGLFRALAMSLENFAHDDCKILIACHPACFGALALRRFGPGIPSRNIMSLTRADHDRARGLIAERVGAEMSAVHNIVVWGINSSVQHCDVNLAFVAHLPNGFQYVRELVANDEWLAGGFTRRLRRCSYDISRDPIRTPYSIYTVRAICNHIGDWFRGTEDIVSVGMISNGQYNVPAGVLGSFPAYCEDGRWVIHEGFSDGEFMEDRSIQARDYSVQFHEEALGVLNAEED